MPRFRRAGCLSSRRSLVLAGGSQPVAQYGDGPLRIRLVAGAKYGSGMAVDQELVDAAIEFAYGPDVAVAVPEPADPRQWRTLRLRDVQPHWFARVFPDEVWPFEPDGPTS